MPHDRQHAGACPKCDANAIVCSYNHFERDDLVIDSWEHKCANCGFRETKAYRSDESPADEAQVNPALCPYCGRRPGGEG